MNLPVLTAIPFQIPGGTSNTSFCSNSACHGASWDYAGFDAPALRETIIDLLPAPQPSPGPVKEPDDPEDLTYSNLIAGILLNRCDVCHGESAQAGLNISTYSQLMAGSENGTVINPGNPDTSLLMLKTSGEEAHFAQFTSQELKLIQDWISAGAVE